AGRLPEGHVVIYDDDQYYMAGVIAEKLLQAGRRVSFVTPGLEVSSWSQLTDEQFRVHTQLLGAGAAVHLTRRLVGSDGATARLRVSVFGPRGGPGGIGVVGGGPRPPADELAGALQDMRQQGGLPQVETLRVIGDAHVPGAIYAAVYAGHRAAREFGEDIDP